MASENKATPEAYARVFENHAEGRLILDDLTARFGGGIYVKGGLEGDRQTCFNAGRRRMKRNRKSAVGLAPNPPRRLDHVHSRKRETAI
jgi:hypothetical protein